MTAQSSSNESSQKNEDSGKNGTATGHQQANNYSTGQRKSLNSSYMNTKMPQYKHSYKFSPQRPPLTTPCEKLQKKLKPVTQTSIPIRTPQETWARSNAEKAQAFANHLATVFQPHLSEPNSIPEATLTSLLETPFQLEPLVTRLKRSEVQAIINNLSTKKFPWLRPHDRQNPQRTAHPLHPISNPALQYYITPRLLSSSMESRPDNPHPEAREIPTSIILLPTH
jgi:hypothetical protein